jgi:hypothetical protein
MSDQAPSPQDFNEESVYTPAGNWRPVIGDLTRWLRLNRCWECASGLEQHAQSVLPSSPPEVEIEAVRSIMDELVYITNNPPQFLEPEKYKELRALRHHAIRSVSSRQRQLAIELETTARAVRSLTQHMERLKAARAEQVNSEHLDSQYQDENADAAILPSDPTVSSQAEIPPLDDEDEQILCALESDRRHLLTQETIEIRSRISRKTIGKRLTKLERAGLVQRPKGPRGGTTISPRGTELLRQIDGAKSTR